MSKEEILSEVLNLVDDVGYKDFDRGKYLNAWHRANRKVARRYHLFQKRYSFSPGEMLDDMSKDLMIDLPDMKEPILVNVNGVNLRKKDYQILDNKDMYCYYMFRETDGTYLFNYVKGMSLVEESYVSVADISASVNQGVTERDTSEDSAWHKSADDIVVILYEALQERDFDETEYVIPNNYEEELIEWTILYMAKYGIARFENQSEKLAKWARIHNMYKKLGSIDPEVAESKEPVRIQVFQYP